ncbi:YcaO-like family protein [Rhizobium sp. BK251]|uniref:YcaO-like family protein n=1 Tax=Rhizobium sp. BK251 TaxID=2512125 RepID=UPI0010E1A4AC|nr:YcaO-like family protein [Rhizobium sp. BK251]TCL74572.1 YcaO-like protein with predicted kinase domain [Rhizobium sp. BK251]
MPSRSEIIGDNGGSSDGGASDFRASIMSQLHAEFPSRAGNADLEQFYRRLLPLSRRACITRIGDITGLDRLGLPVVQTVRPAAQSEVTSLGRGFSIAEAAIGAIMESLERFYSESISPDRVYLAAAKDLGIEDGLFDNLLAAGQTDSWRGKATAWINGIDMATGAVQPVPLELVHTSYTDPPPSHDGIFLRTTTGLACHANGYEAFLHGLFECIERDAIARAFATHGFFDRARLDEASLGGKVSELLSLAGQHGIVFGLWHAPSPAGVPVVWCQSIETGRGEPILALPTEGYSAGTNIEAAAVNAMLEALAARAGAISGARDDQTIGHYRRSTDAIVSDAVRLIVSNGPKLRPGDKNSQPISSLSALIDSVLSAGLGPVIAVPVAFDMATGVCCVRTILPGAWPLTVIR